MEYEPRNDEETVLYYRWMFASLMANGQELIVRNFEADFGRVHDLYQFDGKVHHKGLIQNEYGYGCDVYKTVGKKHQLLNSKPVTFDIAKEILLKTVGTQE